jgi:hypothetical protein
MDETGTLVWQLVLALFVAWIVCFLTLFRGIKVKFKMQFKSRDSDIESVHICPPTDYQKTNYLKLSFKINILKKQTGVIVYVTGIFPYIVLLILGINAWLLEGAEIGIEYYIGKVDINKLSDPIVWKRAAVQVFFTLSLSYGGNM